MILCTKLLNLVGILTIASYKTELVAGSDEVDEDTSLKQALFLIGLLKSDFAKVLRENANLTNEVNENSNSTCPIPLDSFNTTTATNETDVTVSGVASSSTSEVSTPTPLQNLVIQPGTSELPVFPFSSWPSMPMGYPSRRGLGQQGNIPDENYRFPYRFNRRRMIPDYYYFDSPMNNREPEPVYFLISEVGAFNLVQCKIAPTSETWPKQYTNMQLPTAIPGKFRRLDGSDPTGDLGNVTATAQTQTTTKIPSTTSQAPTVNEEKTTTTISTMIAQSSTSTLPTTEPLTLLTTQPSTLPTTQRSTLPTIQPSTLPPTEQSILPTTEHLTQQTTEPTTLLTKPRNRVGFKRRRPVSKARARATVISKHKEKLKLNIVNHRHLRQETTASVTGNCTSEDVEMSQVASELIKEFNGTQSENITNILNPCKNVPTLISRTTSTTMKIYLKGSSRLPVPFPENNAFCHFYPHNVLCGSMS